MIKPREVGTLKHIAIMLPQNYRGGSLRTSKNIAKSIFLGAQKNNFPVEVCFSYVKGGNYDVQNDFADLLEMGITVRETEWKTISRDKVSSIISTAHLQKSVLTEPKYIMPTDGASDFYDCDLWVIISDRTTFPVFPIKKYLIVIYDYIQRYVPEIFETTEVWNIQERSYFITTRSASGIFVTTPNTRDDMISYCGVNKDKIHLINMDFTPLLNRVENTQKTIQKPYFLWPTNTTQHKNHKLTLQGLEKYFIKSDALDCYIIGTNTHYFLSNQKNGGGNFLSKQSYISQIREIINASPILKTKIHILGEVTDAVYMQMISNAVFLLHSCLYDNGTFCVLDAAYMGRPSLSAKYPAMEYMNQYFKLNLRFFNPHDPNTLAQQLQFMQEEAKNIVLPSKRSFKKYSWQANADSLFKLIIPYLE